MTKKTYTPPELKTLEIDLGVFGNYGSDDGGDDGGGCGDDGGWWDWWPW